MSRTATFDDTHEVTGSQRAARRSWHQAAESMRELGDAQADALQARLIRRPGGI